MMVDGSGASGNSGKGMNMKTGVITEWKDIPVDLLMQILSLVHVHDHTVMAAASEVCRGWRYAIYSRVVTSLSLSWCEKNINNLVLSLAPKVTALQTLILPQGQAQLEDNAVETIANFCHDLQILDLSKSFKLTDRSLYAIALGCRDLKNLNIGRCSAFSDNALAYLASLCRKLEVLNLRECVKAASDTALQAIGQYCNQLQSLTLGWCENVSDVGMMNLAYGCPDLRSLNLSGCVLITDDSVIALANRCPHLRSLGLWYCQNITDRAMYSLAKSQVKNRRNNDEDGLKILNISQCTALTPSAVQAVCDSSPGLHTCLERRSLYMKGCLNLRSVRCTCAVQPHRSLLYILHRPIF